MTNVKVQRKDVISDGEIFDEIARAERQPSEFERLRAKAIVSLAETGKRRSEIASLEKTDLWNDSNYLYVRFTVVKKRKRNIRTLQRIKKYRLDSIFAKHIQAYLEYMKTKHPDCTYLFPRIHTIFGLTRIFDYTKPMNGQTVWRIIKSLNPQDWPHQHRERRAVKVIKNAEEKHGQADLNTVYQVRDVLDLERETTAYNYIRRFQTQRVEDEEDQAI